VDAILGSRVSIETLITCALEGERLGAGSAHADNIAPSLYGGLVLVRCPSPPDVVRLPVPAGLTAVVVHPHLEIETARARALIGDTVRLADAVRQWANLGALVDGLHRGDFSLISRSLEDFIAEPRRASLVPGWPRSSARRSMPARSAASVRIRSCDLRAVRESRSGAPRGGRHDGCRAGRDRR
jgi:homoserine kinase